MGENQESFRDDLEKLAQVSDLIESSFIKNEKVKVKVSLDEGTFSNLLQHLMINQNEKKCVIQISNLEFTFLRK
jgi:acetolactate synthase small subunit